MFTYIMYIKEYNDVAITKAWFRKNAIKRFQKYYIFAVDKNVFRLRMHRKGYVKNIHIITEY